MKNDKIYFIQLRCKQTKERKQRKNALKKNSKAKIQRYQISE
jgi:hypothetical protein